MKPKPVVLLPMLAAMLACVFALATADDVPQFVGDYANIASLNYVTDDAQNGSPAACFAAGCQMQEFLRTGEDFPRSQRYLRIKADWSDEVPTKKNPWTNFGPIQTQHGFSSPRLGWQMCNTYGVCPLSMCGRFARSTTAEMDAAALPVRVGCLLGLADIPDYPAALAFLAANHGAFIVLTEDGYDAYAIVGVDSEPRGIWLRFYGGNGTAAVSHLDAAAGQLLWDSMIRGNKHTPDNYMVAVKMWGAP